MKLRDRFKARADEAAAKLRTLAEIEEPTAEQADEAKALGDEIDGLLAKIAEADATDARLAKVAGVGAGTQDAPVPVVRDVHGNVSAVVVNRSIQVTQPDLTVQERIGVCAWASLKNKKSPAKTALQHLEDAGFTKIADDSRAVAGEQSKAITSLSGGGGDNMIMTPLSNDWIDFLRNSSAFLAGNPVPVDLSYGSLDIPGGNASATGAYGAENTAIGYSQMTTRKVSLSAKHLRGLTAMSNYAISISPLAMASIVGNDLTQSLGLSCDAAGLRGDGTGSNPTGVKSLLNASNVYTATATTVAPTLAQIDVDIKKALTLYRTSNVPRVRPYWIMSNRVFTYLQFMRDTIAGYVFPGLQNAAAPTWYDNIPVLRSEQIPSNLGAGTNESELYLVDFGHVLMGTARALRIEASNEASYINASSTLVSAFALDETVIRGIMSHDFDIRYDKAGVLIDTVKWGA